MYAFEQDVPINATIYGRITSGLDARLAAVGGTAPPGALLHIAIEREDGHLSYLDLWESEEDCNRFAEEHLHPIVGPALAEAGIHVDVEPARRPVKVIDVWGPAFPRAATV
jgi:hypothetical protein